MSKSLSALKNRRTSDPSNSGSSQSSYQQQNFLSNSDTSVNNSPIAGGFTLQQVITLIDKRLIALESNKKDLDNSSSFNNVNQNMMEEFNRRFELLAEEISNLKDIVLSLQSYTLDVNKVLMEERSRIMTEQLNDSDA